jgi:Protein of unknown function (DUF2911)
MSTGALGLWPACELMIYMMRQLIFVLTAVSPLLALAGQGGGRLSPHETASLDLSNDKITISYGRPYLKGRKVGNEVAPYGQVWRLGADEATKITVTHKTRLGDKLDLEPGSYSLFAVPGADKWTVIVNKVANQWGAFSYKQSEDLGRFDAPVKPASPPVEQFTITLTKQSENAGTLTFSWGDASVTTSVKAM